MNSSQTLEMYAQSIEAALRRIAEALEHLAALSDEQATMRAAEQAAQRTAPMVERSEGQRA